jgi:hypothetical protein
VAFLNDPRLPTEPRPDSIAQMVAGDRIKAASLAPVALQGGYTEVKTSGWVPIEMAATYEEILTLFRDVATSQQELTASQQELTASQQELAASQKETDLQIKETSREIAELKKLFTSQWGKLMESLVEGDLVNLLNTRGIAITDTTTRLKGKRADGGNFEFDILAHNGLELVVVEVKTTLRPGDVKTFLGKLDHFKQWLPRYANNRIYGAMAWLSADAGAEAMLANRGLFSIRATGDSASIQNDTTFVPRAW